VPFVVGRFIGPSEQGPINRATTNMTDPKHCRVLVPIATAIENETQQALGELQERGYDVQFLLGASAIDLARSVLATRAMDDGFFETMWIDADIVFDPDDVDRIRAHNRPLTAGLYLKKGRKEFAAVFPRGSRQVSFGQGGGLQEMEYVGTGFLHVRSEVYFSIEAKLGLPRCHGAYDGKTVVPYFLPAVVHADGRYCYLSEDYSFCHRARLAGYPVFADTRIRLSHMGKYAYTWEWLGEETRLEALQITVNQQ
jgi:hypothetical protein